MLHCALGGKRYLLPRRSPQIACYHSYSESGWTLLGLARVFDVTERCDFEWTRGNSSVRATRNSVNPRSISLVVILLTTLARVYTNNENDKRIHALIETS